MKCAIYGAGSLGTILGAYLTKSGFPIELVNRNVKHVEALQKNGAHISGTVDLAEDGVVVTLQNGIPEPGIAEIVGENRTIGCTVEWGATMTEPGNCELTSDPDSLSFHMGGMDGISEESLNKVKEVLEHMCPVDIEDNLLGARWSKLLINATFSGLGTVIGGTFGDVATWLPARKVALACMKECIDVAQAGGVEFAPVQGKDITKLFYYKNNFKYKFAEFLLPVAMRKHFSIFPSMLQDVLKGKPCEIDAINGVVCEWGKKYGVPTPVIFQRVLLKTNIAINSNKGTGNLILGCR